ncbi:hypothetical protein GGR56DRAFT_512052 [Xylariaceae sp. FL0804]|nr:hypothetical protein GGR56DRAFT_512052 [Xylariaceae sp. FL0804]
MRPWPWRQQQQQQQQQRKQRQQEKHGLFPLRAWRSRDGASHPQRHPHGQPAPPHPQPGLTSLPPELQLLVLSQLDLAELVQLRQTCRLFRLVITPELVRRQFTRDGRARPLLRGCCNACLCMPGLDRLIVDADLPPDAWRSICFRCWRARLGREYHLNPWPVVTFASGAQGYICQFCNWPVAAPARSGGPGADAESKWLHASCKRRRHAVLATWMVMAFMQFGLGILGGVLAWTRYIHQPRVFIPATIDFGLSILAVIAFVIRICTTTEKTYARALATEMVVATIRLPPVTYTLRETVIKRLQVGLLPKFGFGVFLINLVFRLLDFMGHALLNCGYDPRKLFLAGLSWRKKLLFGFCTFMVWFAYIPF